MPAPNIDEILAKNPRLDREVFEQNQRKIEAARMALPTGQRPAGKVAVPYSGKRLRSSNFLLRAFVLTPACGSQ